MRRNYIEKPKVVAAFLAVYVIWGTTFLAIRIAVTDIPPFLMAAIRFMLAGGIMLVILLLRGIKFPKLLHWRSAFIVGGLMLAGGNGLLSYAEQDISSAMAALLVGSMPIWVAALEWLMFNGNRPKPQTIVGLLIGLSGLAILFIPGSEKMFNPLGIILVLIATMLWAIGALYSRQAALPKDTLMSTAAEMLAGGILLLIISLARGEPAQVNLSLISFESIVAMFYLSILGSIIAYTAYIWLMKTVDAAKVNSNFYVNPIIALFVGSVIGGEVITPLMTGAMAIILVGVAVISMKSTTWQRILERLQTERIWNRIAWGKER